MLFVIIILDISFSDFYSSTIRLSVSIKIYPGKLKIKKKIVGLPRIETGQYFLR